MELKILLLVMLFISSLLSLFQVGACSYYGDTLKVNGIMSKRVMKIVFGIILFLNTVCALLGIADIQLAVVPLIMSTFSFIFLLGNYAYLASRYEETLK